MPYVTPVSVSGTRLMITKMKVIVTPQVCVTHLLGMHPSILSSTHVSLDFPSFQTSGHHHHHDIPVCEL